MQNACHTYHLLPDHDRWDLTSDAGEKIFSGIESRSKALNRAMLVVWMHGGSLKIHKEDGSIEDEKDYPRRAASNSGDDATV